MSRDVSFVVPEYVKQSGYKIVRPCWTESRGVYWQGKIGEKFTGDNLIDVWQDIDPPNTKEGKAQDE